MLLAHETWFYVIYYADRILKFCRLQLLHLTPKLFTYTYCVFSTKCTLCTEFYVSGKTRFVGRKMRLELLEKEDRQILMCSMNFVQILLLSLKMKNGRCIVCDYLNFLPHFLFDWRKEIYTYFTFFIYYIKERTR